MGAGDVGACLSRDSGSWRHESFRVDRLRLYLVGYQMRSLKHEKYTKRVLDAAAHVEEGVHVHV